MPRFIDPGTGVIISVPDAAAARRMGPQWRPVEAPEPPPAATKKVAPRKRAARKS